MENNFQILYLQAKELNLINYELLTDSNITKYCDGLGDRWMAPETRAIVKRYNPILRLPAAIHDIDCGLNGTIGNQTVANKKFLTNCKRIIKVYYSWCNPMRIVALHQAKKMYKLFDRFDVCPVK